MNTVSQCTGGDVKLMNLSKSVGLQYSNMDTKNVVKSTQEVSSTEILCSEVAVMETWKLGNIQYIQWLQADINTESGLRIWHSVGTRFLADRSAGWIILLRWLDLEDFIARHNQGQHPVVGVNFRTVTVNLRVARHLHLPAKIRTNRQHNPQHLVFLPETHC